MRFRIQRREIPTHNTLRAFEPPDMVIHIVVADVNDLPVPGSYVEWRSMYNASVKKPVSQRLFRHND